ncbi:MAG: hypothetical protein HOH43_26935 [Candidatus Latescibacteria bacterium]|jgi:hypothetical protein|nr:hypothetical protein [Candidatus Latescibacterota bacterium]
MATPLSGEQVRQFKTQGYLVLKRMFDGTDLQVWREQIWQFLNSSYETPGSWPTDISGLDDFKYNPPTSTFARHPRLLAIMDQLGGGDFIEGDGIPIIRWPTPDPHWEIPKTGHIDAYGGRWLPFMFGATTYLYDVAPHGGSFVYWPESHLAAHRYFRAHPEEVDGSFLQKKDFSWDVFCDNPATGGREFTAQAGDVVLWHSYLTHNGSTNINDSPRMALFARYDHRKRQEDDFRYDIPQDMWEHWAI